MTRKWTLIFLTLIIISCQENKDNEVVDIQSPIFTGITDNISLNVTPINFILPITWGPCGICDIKDSIDINDDNSYDIVLKARFLNEDLFWSPDCCPPPADCVPLFVDFSIKMQNDFEIAYFDIPFVFSDEKGDIVADFKYNTRIDTLSNWTTSTFFWMQYHDAPSPWGQFDQDKYIAIRKQIQEYYNYGWIRVKSSPFRNIEFIEVVIEDN